MAEEFLTDIEADLAKLLAVDPSPEFCPGVRARIASEPRRLWAGWRSAALVATAAVAVIAIGVTLLRLIPGPEVTRPASPHVAASDVRLAIVREPAPPPDRVASQPPSTVATRRGTIPAPVVIVDQAQARAVLRLLDAAALGGRIVESPAAAAGSVLPIPLSELVVEPLEVPELRPDNKGVER